MAPKKKPAGFTKAMREKKLAKARLRVRLENFAVHYEYSDRYNTRGRHKHIKSFGEKLLSLAAELQNEIFKWVIIAEVNDQEDAMTGYAELVRPKDLPFLQVLKPSQTLYHQALAEFYKQGHPLRVDADDWLTVKKLPDEVCTVVKSIQAKATYVSRRIAM